MIAALRQNALPLAMILVCAAALYLVYRDMKRIGDRLNRLDAAVIVLAEDRPADACGIHDDYEAALAAEAEFDAEFEAGAEFELVAEPEPEPEAEAEPEHEAETEAEPEAEPAAVA